MGIYLALEHTVLQFLFLFLISDTPFKQLINPSCQFIDPSSNITQLILPFNAWVAGEVTMCDCLHPLLDLCNGSVEEPVKQEGEYGSKEQDCQQDNDQHGEVGCTFKTYFIR